MDHSHCSHNCHGHSANKSVCQTLSEMDWERGIWNAAYSGDKDKIMELLHKSKNPTETVNALDNSGYTALHYAARNGYLDICKVLIKNGAIIDAQTKSGKATPLHKAAASGKIEVIRFLIASGAKTDLIDDDGKNMLHKAVEYKRDEVANMLLETHPNLQNCKDKRGLMPLEYKK